MKFFHLSDLHIGLNLCGRDMIEDQDYVLNQIVDKVRTEKPDAIVIAGDIYDRPVPSVEAVKLCNKFLANMVDAADGHPIMIISGNHDNGERIGYMDFVAEKSNLIMVGNPPRFEDEYIKKISLEDKYGMVNYYLLPFVKPSMVKNILGVSDDGRNYTYDETIKLLLKRETIDSNSRNVIVSHQFYCPINTEAAEFKRTDSEIIAVGNIDAVSTDYLKAFDYAALGHIHTPMSLGDDSIVYCGTPLACSISEAGQSKAIVVVELNKKDTSPIISKIPLIPKHVVSRIEGTLEDILSKPSDDYVSIVITDKDEGIAQFNRDRIKTAFPNYLDVNIKRDSRIRQRQDIKNVTNMDPLDFCKEFTHDTLSEEDIAIISDIINKVKEG